MADRFFLVGCARSGTTLVQSLLAAHPAIASFPESHFFRRLAPTTRWRCRLGLPSDRARPQLERFLDDIARPGPPARIPRRVVTMKQYVDFFIGVLDDVTKAEGKTVWIEKTPSHLWHIEEIERHVSGAKFIHILRNGPDVVASLYEVMRRYPEIWTSPYTLDDCVDRWLRDVAITRSYEGKPGHFVVRYEELVADPDVTLAGMCGFLGVEVSADMLGGHTAAAERIVLRSEPWKAEAFGEIRSANERKFYEVLTSEQRGRVLARLDSAAPAAPR